MYRVVPSKLFIEDAKKLSKQILISINCTNASAVSSLMRSWIKSTAITLFMECLRVSGSALSNRGIN
jgi:hypothetical protein